MAEGLSLMVFFPQGFQNFRHLEIRLSVSAFEKCPGCHPERSEGSGSPDAEILRFAQDDSQDISQGRSQKGLSPNVYGESSDLDIGAFHKIHLES